MVIRVLLGAKSASTRRRVESALAGEGIVLVSGRDQQSLWERVAHEDFDLVVVSDELLPQPAARQLDRLRNLPGRPEVVVLSESDLPQARGELLGAGCLAVLHLAIDDAALAQALGVIVERLRQGAMGRIIASRSEERFSLADFISASPVMDRFLFTARRVVGTDSSLLVLGETGVGKERLARAIHAEGPRSAAPFVALNCGALSESLLESELFGHEQGAFTGATRARRGYFELAHGGTIFLDEIGEMPLHVQVRLLRVLEDRRILRVGGERPIEVDVRVIAATNRDLEAEANARRFRQDLYFRLAVVTLVLPPLRERREDIPALVSSYLAHFSSRFARRMVEIEPDAMDALVAYDWPGNTRELINVLEQLVLLSSGERISRLDLPRRIGSWDDASLPPGGTEILAAVDANTPLRVARRQMMDAFERTYLSALLERTRGRVGEAASVAGVNPRSLHALMKRHRLMKEDYRE